MVFGNSAGGSVTITPKNDTTKNYTLTIPDVSGTVALIDSPTFTGTPTAPTAAASTNTTQIATTAMVHSAITNDLHVTGTAPMYACRAWVNFDGTASSPTPRASGNISSITKNGNGDYTINFITAMPDANYAFIGTSSDPNDDSVGPVAIGMKASAYTPSTTARRFETTYQGANIDSTWVHIAIFR